MTRVCPIDQTALFRKAGPTDLIQLRPAPGVNALYLPKFTLEAVVYGLTHGEFIHLSGPTGSAKTSLIEALYLVPENCTALCVALSFEYKPLKVFPVPICTYETPSELFSRRAIKNGATYDEDSRLVQALEEAVSIKEHSYPVIWLREIGRAHAASVQGGLLDLMTRTEILLPDGRRIDTSNVAFVADSNYQAADDVHTQVTFDDALKRRLAFNITMEYLSADQEVEVLRQLMGTWVIPKHLDHDPLLKLVQLGQSVRRCRAEGALLSVVPPTIYGSLACLRMLRELPHLSLQQVTAVTLLGNASPSDKKLIPGIYQEVFGLAVEEDEELAMGSSVL